MTDQTPNTVARLNAALEGRYRIDRELGEGGMATVYLADDLRHERKVAVKVLRPELAAVVGADRFLAEIKTTANLQHPHILPLFDSGEADSFLFYVMPYLEGESIRELITKEKQLGVKDALSITRKVSDALDYAHEHGVVHRDIKPGNILLSERGEPLVADFGIALAVAQAGGGRITETGLSLGTPHYMSPEQATGDRDVDARSDVYALGCVLYEMLSGRPPFSASTAQGVLVQILTTDPPSITGLRRTVPLHIEGVLARALEKLPADRFKSAAGFSRALDDESFVYAPRPIATDPGRPAVQVPASVTEVVAPKKGRDFRLISAIGVAAIFAGLAAWGWLQPEPILEELVPTRTVLTGLDIDPSVGWRFGISPDGRWIVAGATDGNERSLYLRSASEVEWRLIENTGGGSNPSFSPDGQWILFDVNFSSILRVPINGGPALPVFEGGGNAHWAENDSIVFTTGGAIHIVPSSGGESTVLLANDTLAANRPYLLPGGRGVLFQSGGGAASSSVLLLNRETGQVRSVAPAGNQPRYAKTGHVLFGHGDQALMAVPFDLETLEVTGNQSTVLPTMTVFAGGASQYAFSENGTLIYASEGALGSAQGRQLAVVDMEGNETVIPIPAGPLDAPRYSPDGSMIAYQDGGEIRIYNVATGASPQFTSGGGLYPVWSPSGDYLYYTESVGGPGLRRPPDASEAASEVYGPGGQNFIRSVAPGDSFILVRRNGGNTARDLLVTRMGSSAEEFEGYLTAQWNEGNAEFSPDGNWIAYQSDESGVRRVYVHSFPNLTGQRSISPGPGSDPTWGPDGNTIYYRNGAQFLSVDLTFEPSFSVSAPELLFEEVAYGRQLIGGAVRNRGIHPDGQSFVVVRGTNEGGFGSGLGEVHLVVNWFEELKARTDG